MGLGRWVLAAAVMGAAAYSVSACTAITLAEWNGYTSDGGSAAQGADAAGDPSACSSAYMNAVSACGACIESSCTAELGKVCAIDAGYSTSWADNNVLPCAQNPSVNSFDCNVFLKAADAAVSSSNDPAALESNATQCIKRSCHDACRRCPITYPGCTSSVSITLGNEKSSSCGKCIVANCTVELANGCGDVDHSILTNCAQNSTDACRTPDCSGLTTDAGSVNGNLVLACVRSKCASECQ